VIGRRRPFVPTWVTEVELEAPIEAVVPPPRHDGSTYGRVRVLGRRAAEPLGLVELPVVGGAVPADVVAAAFSDRTGDQLESRRPHASSGDASSDALVSVIICSRDRGEMLRAALGSILAVDYQTFEVVVVDSSPATEATSRIVQEADDRRIRYVHERRSGLSRARNSGIQAARGEILAFTDDDVAVDRGWLRAIVRGFAQAPQVDCVTGLVVGAELETAPQAYFEAKVNWASSFEPRLYDLAAHRSDDPRYPYCAGLLGTGANFAVSSSAARSVGAFDEALGAGSPPQGGEDLDYFLRILLAGGTIAYEPASLVWHLHRRDESALARQMYGYGAGLTAFVFKHLASKRTRRDLARRLPVGSWRLFFPAREARRSAPVVRGARAMELCGMLAGPFDYVRANRSWGRLGRRGWSG
jgi:glycosyltransferase involved in cell wall biosynthesis